MPWRQSGDRDIELSENRDRESKDNKNYIRKGMDDYNGTKNIGRMVKNYYYRYRDLRHRDRCPDFAGGRTGDCCGKQRVFFLADAVACLSVAGNDPVLCGAGI